MQFYIANQDQPTLGGFFPAPQQYSHDAARRGESEQVAGGPSIHQTFGIEESDRIITFSGVMKTVIAEAILRPAFEADSALCEFSDGENYWIVKFWSLSISKTSGGRTAYNVELKVCRRIV